MMMRFSRAVVFLAACSLLLACICRAQATAPSPQQQLIKDVAYNELQDRERDSFWAYDIDQKVGQNSYAKRQVETQQGPIFRILEQNGKPLTDAEARREQARLEHLINSPSALARNREDHKQDEERLQRLTKLMPNAFLFEQDGPASGDLVTFRFKPNPDFDPPTYEARIFHGMAGVIVINQRLKRFVSMRGTVINRIDFGYGLLGYVDKGGRFEVHRQQVSTTCWKTDLVDVHVSGRVILFKSVSKDHREARSDFQPVPTDISLTDAKHLLDQAASENEAELKGDPKSK
ncbi:hypothetical protein [Alloacidobacterium dinghuense]|uniref:hypothetical protein n=1 Tax=Alloacidobacterium dinghuense TaxID=2763107 RepID=UPI002036CE4D|nr:hypothetical protein [Alloacidobacterium dinghuense]